MTYRTNWELLVERYRDKINQKYQDNQGNLYRFFGLVHSDDDYYYGLWDVKNRTLALSSCVGRLEDAYTEVNP